LRIEDIDSPRVKPAAAEQALDDLRWLGLDWDQGPDVGGPSGPYIQTERRELYAEELDALRRAERIYPCTCTRRDVEEAGSAPHLEHEPPVYSGRCRKRSAAEADSLDKPFAWRFRTSDGPRAFRDLIAGPQLSVVRRELGDFVIAKADGSPAYQLAVVVDDHAMGVTEVIRGDDLLPSTFRQLELYEFFGWAPPSFAHVPLVVGPDGRRLAKRHGDSRLAVLREAGTSPEALVGLLARSCGLRETSEPTTPHELLDDFDLSQVTPQPFVFTPAMWQSLIE
jgi:glutamyl-tRNA synthetase